MAMTRADRLRARGAQWRMSDRRCHCYDCGTVIAKFEKCMDAGDGTGVRICECCANANEMTLSELVARLIELCEPDNASDYPEQAKAWNDVREAVGQARVWRES